MGSITFTISSAYFQSGNFVSVSATFCLLAWILVFLVPDPHPHIRISPHILPWHTEMYALRTAVKKTGLIGE
ncbi:unnamed protein product [Calicophoron daubneyi]|uniref:Uncharacterized protein n=1 Tax=Calicophoron daubneyi TaxID=300641 RepID=A0AAV2T283_CALDB